MATSYISEHSAEYYLVPALKEILQVEFSHVAPVFPWIHRELSKLSRHLHNDDQFHVLVMFPRRPKLLDQKSCEIHVTINPELDDFSKAGVSNGVPVIAGCPQAINIWDLSNCKKYAWLDLTQKTYHESPYSLKELEENRCLLEEEDILSLVRKSTIFNLQSFEDFFRAARATQPIKIYGSLYKPVYFLIKVY